MVRSKELYEWMDGLMIVELGDEGKFQTICKVNSLGSLLDSVWSRFRWVTAKALRPWAIREGDRGEKY